MEEIRGRILSQEKDLYRVKSELGECTAEVSGKYRYQAATVSDYPAVGDYVLLNWPEGDSRGIITSLFPRKSCFIRKAAGPSRREQVVAANVDYVFLCMSLNNDFNLRRLERYISIGWNSGATPVVVLTKADLCTDLEEKLRRVSTVAMGIDVITVSSYLGEFDRVYDYVNHGKTVAFIGSSGVGKSTLINKLIGEDRIETQGLRNDDKGRHTTTHRELMELSTGGFVIDTPGMRELGMWDSDAGIDTAFTDVEELLGCCKFSNCTHTKEPGCAIRQALEDGSLPWERWESYQKLKSENQAAVSSEYLAAKKAKFREIAIKNKNNRKR